MTHVTKTGEQNRWNVAKSNRDEDISWNHDNKIMKILHPRI